MSIAICLVGNAGTGKDEIAEFISKYYNFERVSIAASLKSFALAAQAHIAIPETYIVIENEYCYTVTLEDVLSDYPTLEHAKNANVEVRKALEDIAIALTQTFGENILVSTALNTVKDVHSEGIVVQDVTYDHDVRYIKSIYSDVYVVRVTKDGCNTPRVAAPLPAYDLTWHNDDNIQTIVSKDIKRWVGF